MAWEKNAASRKPAYVRALSSDHDTRQHRAPGTATQRSRIRKAGTQQNHPTTLIGGAEDSLRRRPYSKRVQQAVYHMDDKPDSQRRKNPREQNIDDSQKHGDDAAGGYPLLFPEGAERLFHIVQRLARLIPPLGAERFVRTEKL